MKIKENKERNGKINNSNNTKMGLRQMEPVVFKTCWAIFQFWGMVLHTGQVQPHTDSKSQQLDHSANYI